MRLTRPPLEEYPRPQLERESYLSLNRYWEYAIRDNENIPESFDGHILVPYSPEAPLSGVNRIVKPNEWLFYKLIFKINKDFIKDKVLLHFTAVDQITEVYFNDNYLGKHIDT